MMSNRKGGIGAVHAFSRAWRTPNPGAHRKFIPVCRVRGLGLGRVAGKGTKKDVASSESAYLAKGSYCANWNCKIANWTCSRTRPSLGVTQHTPLRSTETVFVEKYSLFATLSLHASLRSRTFVSRCLAILIRELCELRLV